MKPFFFFFLLSIAGLPACSTRYEEELHRDNPASRDSTKKPHKLPDTSDYDQVDL